MGFSDIFKSNFLDNVTSVSVPDMLLGMLFACILSLFIFVIYKKTCTGIMYSSSFGLTLVGLSLVTTLVIMAVTSNVVLSLGMVGALSIVRFRTAIKEPMEIIFLFWSLAVGIVIGAGFYPLATVGSVVIGVILLILANRKTYEMPYILVVSCQNDTAAKAALSYVAESTQKNIIKTKTVMVGNIELTVEVRLKENDTLFMDELMKINGISNVSLVSFNGEYMA